MVQSIPRPSIQRLSAYEGTDGCWREVAPDILLVPFRRVEFCRELFDASETGGDVQRHAPDVRINGAPGQELRIDRISARFAERSEAHFPRRAAPIVKTHWWPLATGKTRMPFVLRYTPDTQAALGPHHDAALVGFAMPLNAHHESGVLTFARQHWDSREVEAGTRITFPSRVGHVHWVTPVSAGKRYAMSVRVDPADHPRPTPSFHERAALRRGRESDAPPSSPAMPTKFRTLGGRPPKGGTVRRRSLLPVGRGPRRPLHGSGPVARRPEHERPLRRSASELRAPADSSVLHLTECAGGSTVFPQLGIEVPPEAGGIIAQPASMLHGVRPIAAGPKRTLASRYTGDIDRGEW